MWDYSTIFWSFKGLWLYCFYVICDITRPFTYVVVLHVAEDVLN